MIRKKFIDTIILYFKKIIFYLYNLNFFYYGPAQTYFVAYCSRHHHSTHVFVLFPSKTNLCSAIILRSIINDTLINNFFLRVIFWIMTRIKYDEKSLECRIKFLPIWNLVVLTELYKTIKHNVSTQNLQSTKYTLPSITQNQ